MKLTILELRDLKQRMERILDNENSTGLQIYLANIWLGRIKKRGRYALDNKGGG